MKKVAIYACIAVFSSTTAYAADLSPSYYSSGSSTTFDWSGLYVGAFGSASFGNDVFDLTDGTTSISLDTSAGGALFGAQVGYDFQAGNMVAGIAADIAYSNFATRLTASVPGVALTLSSDLKYLGTVRGRLGVAMDDFLVYGHGGLAYGKTEQSLSVTGVGSLTSKNDTKLGYTVGAGAEYAISKNISFVTEYAYTDLGKDEIYNDGTMSITEDVNLHTLKAGINFRF